MWGKNLYTGGHFDAYVVDYSDYKPGSIPEDTWEVPQICPSEVGPENAAAQSSHWLTKLRSVLPNVHFGRKLLLCFWREHLKMAWLDLSQRVKDRFILAFRASFGQANDG